MIFTITESKEGRLNLAYVLAHGLYWMALCCTISLGSAYLSNRGYSTVAIGFLFAIAYLVATVLQQFISALADASSKINELNVLAILSGIMILTLFFSVATSTKGFATSFTFFLAVMIISLMQPFLNSLNFYIEKFNIKMNFGVARAAGSFFFFLMSLLAGNLMKATTEKAAPVLGLIVIVLFFVDIIWIYREVKTTDVNLLSDFEPLEFQAKKGGFDTKTVKDFVAKNKIFFLFLVGLVCFYFGHVLINNFIYQIASNVGGDEGDVGGLLALQAIVELPAMIFFNKLKDKFGARKLLGLSAIFYFIKSLATTLATSVGALYFSMIFQSLAFAVFIPASVHFVHEIMDSKDEVKGQAFITMAMTVSNLLSSLVGGVCINLFGVKFSLWYGSFITLCGVIIALYSLVKIRKK